MNRSAQSSDTPERQFGFKVVTLENILEVDPVVASMVAVNLETGEVRQQEHGDWVRLVAAIDLSDKVPREVRRAFAFSRGVLCYAHWYYPALTLGMNDMLRIADFAASEACKERGINRPLLRRSGKLAFFTFSDNIKALAACGCISAGDVNLWKSIRRARNAATHPGAQSIFGFPHAYETLKLVRDLIERIEWVPSQE